MVKRDSNLSARQLSAYHPARMSTPTQNILQGTSFTGYLAGLTSAVSILI
jgi:hypothetical protein